MLVFVRAGEWGPMDKNCWERETPDEIVERVRSISGDSASLVGAAGGSGAKHVGSTKGPTAGNLLLNGFQGSAEAVAH